MIRNFDEFFVRIEEMYVEGEYEKALTELEENKEECFKDEENKNSFEELKICLLIANNKEEEAWKIYDNMITRISDPRYLRSFRDIKRGVYFIKAIYYLKNNDAESAFINFKKHGIYPMDVLGFEELGSKQTRNEIFKKLINENNSFSDKTKSYLNQDSYKDLYLKVISLIRKLAVYNAQGESGDIFVSHYTSQEIISKLLFEGSFFRLNSVVGCNDPKEGKIIDEVLNLSDTESNESNFAAFIGCFTFNLNTLNHFRLYGKNNNNEATGFSLVLKNGFFRQGASLEIKQFRPDPKQDPILQNLHKQYCAKLPLFRCIYIEPKSRKVISVGHKDEFSYYDENPTSSKKKIEKQRRNIKKLINDVESDLCQIRKMIKYSKLEHSVVGELLKPLRYLIKHAAFREEQECRMCRIEELSKNDLLKEGYKTFYIDYEVQIKGYVQRIYLAPLTSEPKYFEMKVRKNGYKDIKVDVCDHPFSTLN